ncbi:spore coat protein CotZ [Neobacillus sedimentimangrovi]|uniref:Spore coat protein CotZ n=1 Tax=Neobacillus sedimentimangrovi TaxID=2699460 RepID=A0ABS8QI82_9BACI|nr:CotY/CotZ family spore coat protein [Neobacillus sedimentimangrovi]MCD4838974.1 spore coat protein CotZ [Neobacillus sedimentimangrovi]
MGCGKSRHDHDKDNCVCQVVRAIKDIQDNAVNECRPCTSCFNEPLGSLAPTLDKVDTRVFVLKTKDGTPFHAFFTAEDPADGCVSIFFRVEEVFDNCCATLRVLIPGVMSTGGQSSHGGHGKHHKGGNQFEPVPLFNSDTCCIDLNAVCQVNAFMPTNDCVTVDLSCFCAIQCIADVFLDICD